MKIEWKRKLSSRKFLAAVAGTVMGLAMVFGLDENTISTVAGAVVSVASVVAYIMAEGKVDAENVKNPANDVQFAVSAIKGTSAIISKTAANGAKTTIYDGKHAFDEGDFNGNA